MTAPSAIEKAADLMSDLTRRNRENEIDLSAEEIAGRTIVAYLRARFDGDGLEPHERILIRRLAAELEHAGTAGEGEGK